MKWRVSLTGAVALLSLVSRPQQSAFVIRQAYVHLPYITAYLDMPEENGRPPYIKDSDISAASIQGQDLKLDNVSLTQGIAYTLLLDVSGSMMIRRDDLDAIRRWIDRLHPDDHLEIFAFGETYRQLGIPASDKATLKSEIGKLRSGERTTNLYSALERSIAYAERTDSSIPEGRMIVLLTDGKDESSDGRVNERKVQDKVRQSHVPIYAIGYTRLGANDQDTYLEKLKSFADESGGFYDCAGTVPSALCPPNELSQSSPNLSLENSFEKLSRRMERIFVLRMTCRNCRESDNHHLQISLRNGTTAEFPIPLMLLLPGPTPKPISTRVYVAGLLLLVIVLVVGWLVLKKKPTPEPASDVAQPMPIPSPEPGLPARFTIVSGQEPGRIYKFTLGTKLVIGRDSGCEVVLLGDQEISGRHCELTRNGTRIEVVDLGSTNGTLLNGARVVGRQRMEDGDLIRVGRTEFRVSFGER